MADEAALSPRSFPQSSRGRLEVIRLLFLEVYRFRIISSKSSAACFGTFLRRNKIVNDQQIGFGEELGHLLSPPELIGFEEVFEKGMGFPVDDLVAGLNGGMRHCLGDVALAGSGRPDQQGIGAVPDKFAADELVDFLFGQLRIEAPVELGQSGPVRQSGRFEAGFHEPRVSPVHFVLHEAGKDLCERSALVGLNESGLQRGAHAMQANRFEISL